VPAVAQQRFPSASITLVAAPATKDSPTEDLRAVEPWDEVSAFSPSPRRTHFSGFG